MNDASIADILNVYLGQNAGEAVLAGNISRGKSFKVTAAILIVDIRGSTPLLQKLGTDSYIDIINKLFDIVTPHVRANDGEVFQFTGDGMLAVFPENPPRPRQVDSRAQSPFRMPTPLPSARTRRP